MVERPVVANRLAYQLWALFLAVIVAQLSGCGPASAPPGSQPTENPDTTSATPPGGDAATGTGATGTGTPVAAKGPPLVASAEPASEELVPYDPPPLAELDAKAGWIDQTVGDSLAMWKAELAQTKPICTVEEALSLENNSTENNAKILSALGRQPASDSEVDYDATFNRHFGRDVKSTNPIMISATEEFDVAGLMGFGLFGSDWRFNPMASKDTVVSWQTSADRLMDKVVMRKDCTWSDGKPITAHDVVFSFQTIMNPKVPVPAMRGGTDKLRWVHAYDDYTLVYFHKEALATNVWNLSFTVIPKHIYGESIKEDVTLQDSPTHVKYENEPVSGGPYVLSKRVRGQEIVMTRREDWYMVNGQQVRDKPYFKEIRFRVITDPNTALLALKTGELDEMMLLPEMWQTQTSGEDFYKYSTKAHGPEWTSFHFAWNTKSPFFSDLRVRQAMAYLFDYDEMLGKLFHGLYRQAAGPFPADAWWAPKPYPEPFKRDIDKAEELLDAAGWVDEDGDGIREKLIDGKPTKFEFSIICPSAPERVQLCTLLKECLDQVGIVCNVKPLEGTVLIQKVMDKDFQAAFGGWGTGSDPDTSENLWKTGEPRNYSSFSNPEVDALFVAGRREFDREKRAVAYGRIHNLVFEAQPYTWLYTRNSFFAFSKQLRGYAFSPRGPYNYGPGLSAIYKVKK
jgi:peptide/nickel transport system substrate-binding protein